MNTHQEFWNARHSGDLNFVTNTSLEETLFYHDLPQPRNKMVTYIGVGGGSLCRQLQNWGNGVYGVDISAVALKKVEAYCIKTALSADLKTLPPCSLAISHLVFQHNPEEEILRIINDVQLKSDGIFSFQFATIDPVRAPELTAQVKDEMSRGIMFFYTPEKMKEIILQSNKEFITDKPTHWFGLPFNFLWNIFQVKNK